MCGVTRLEDAMAGIQAGVDALGFIFYDKSPRNIDPDSALEILNQVPPFISSVGIFVDKEMSEVEDIVRYCRLSHVQLHGQESPEYCERLARLASPSRIIKAFRVDDSLSKEDVAPYEPFVQAFLFDTFQHGVVGGTGQTFDWSKIGKLELRKPYILAGGLKPEIVAQALEGDKPFALDVNSGVEVEPGIKDPDLIREFMQAVYLAMTKAPGKRSADSCC